MNSSNINYNEIKGLLNFIGKSQDFHSEYYRLDSTRLFYTEKEDGQPFFGLTCNIINIPNKVLNLELSPRSYFNLKYFLDMHTKFVPTSHKLFTAISNFANINILAAFVPLYDNGHYITYILMECDGRYLCADCIFSDVVCMRQSYDFPIYIHQDIIFGLGENPITEIKESI